MVGACFGVGFAIAPSLGGYLSKSYGALVPLYISILLQVSCMVGGNKFFVNFSIFYGPRFIFHFIFKKPGLDCQFQRTVIQT